MSELQAAAAFYQSPIGVLAAGLLSEQLHVMWPAASVAGLGLLGIGFAAPFLCTWQARAQRCVALSPAPMGRARWPVPGRNLACTAEEGALPFPDLSFDRVLLVHALENAENDRRLLREVWRVLKDSGELLVVAANRTGLWAHGETTPFGHGRPYSAGQIGALLTESMFRAERRATALFLPPLLLPPPGARIRLRMVRAAERAGRRLAPGLAGVTVTVAVKDVYAGVPAQAVPSRRRLMLVDAA
ncbi:methyltransferase domain-containing protein [Acidisphaera rubrifaciens]|uniref:Methyltransferase n=1 Tax=Acidisphaera rubrifaciens HS-AP3 TaxID=1231350 RepID=A0A0D6PAT4_9PROT|nr:methyltransferase domain-containing protein [Acidisphaera rubrifaciens]GAN77984.1 methyltransferase [Acidisphaera rubrifaciens HS-AP3]